MIRQDGEYDDELWLSHRSCASWCDVDRWVKYFESVQEILGAEITHLDENDPIRRRFDSYDVVENANYVTCFGVYEQSRTIFGKLAAIDVDFSIWYFRDDNERINRINWHAPPDWFQDSQRLQQIRQLFDFGNKALETFFGYVDTCGGQKANARKFRNDGIRMSLEQELGSILWLTYFNDKYVSFFGEDRFRTLDQLGVDVSLDRGATLRLAETPDKVPEGLRRQVEIHLGEKSFVNPDPKDFTVKHPGQYALTFEQLRS